MDGLLLPAVGSVLLGASVGSLEILRRYSDEPLRTLAHGSSLLYVAVNGAISGIAFAILRMFDVRLGAEDLSPGLLAGVQATVAGIAALAVLRIKFVSVGSSPPEESKMLGFGPAGLLESLLTLIDREIDRSRASERQTLASDLLEGLSFKRDHVALTQLAMSSLRSLRLADARHLGHVSKRLTNEASLTDTERLVCYGLDLIQVAGRMAVEGAVVQLRKSRLTKGVSDAQRAEPPYGPKSGNPYLLRRNDRFSVLPSFPPPWPYPDKQELKNQVARLSIGSELEAGQALYMLGKYWDALEYLGSAARELRIDRIPNDYHPTARSYWTSLHYDALLWTLSCHLALGVDLILLATFRRISPTSPHLEFRWIAACLQWLAMERGVLLKEEPPDILRLHLELKTEPPQVARQVLLAALIDAACGANQAENGVFFGRSPGSFIREAQVWRQSFVGVKLLDLLVNEEEAFLASPGTVQRAVLAEYGMPVPSQVDKGQHGQETYLVQDVLDRAKSEAVAALGGGPWDPVRNSIVAGIPSPEIPTGIE